MADAVEKLGDSHAGPAFALLSLLSRNGWWVAVTHAFGGGVLVIASHPSFGRVSKQGASVADVAGEVAQTCLALTASGRMH